MDTAAKQEVLKKDILEDAEKRARTIATRAKRDVKKAKREAEERANAYKQEVLDRATGDVQQEVNRTLSAIPMEKIRRRLQAQEAVIDKAASASSEALMNQSGDERADLVATLIADAARSIAEDEMVVDLAERDLPLAERAIAKAKSLLGADGLRVRIVLGNPDREITGGAIVRTPQGHKLVDHSFEARRERLYPRIRLELARLLFDSSPRH